MISFVSFEIPNRKISKQKGDFVGHGDDYGFRGLCVTLYRVGYGSLCTEEGRLLLPPVP
jgi:hypothetical protein